MPEYLAPAVYVEEVDTGSKPIEGVSTSTAGMLGVTERGPVNIPILITSSGEYRRWFGDLLEVTEFSNANDRHCFLPYAVDGFFTNGGKRVYVTRIESQASQRAMARLYDRGAAGLVESALLRSAAWGTGTAVNGPTIAITEPGALGSGDIIRIGDGSACEYRTIVGALTPSLNLPLQFPTSHFHPTTASLVNFARNIDTGATTAVSVQIVTPVQPGDVTVTLKGAAAPDMNALGVGQVLLEFGGVNGEQRLVTGLGPIVGAGLERDVTLDSPLTNSYASLTANVERLEVPPVAPTLATTSLLTQAVAGEAMIVGSNLSLQFLAGSLVSIAGGTQMEVRAIGALQSMTLEQGAYDQYPAKTRVDRFTATPQQFLASGPPAGNTLGLNVVTGLAPGQTVVIDPAGVPTVHVIQTVDTGTPAITLTTPPPATVGLGTVVRVQRRVTAGIPVGSATIAVSNRVGIAAGDLFLVGPPGAQEFVAVRSTLGAAGSAPDAGTIVLEAPTTRAHAAGEDLVLQMMTPTTPSGRTYLVLPQQIRAETSFVANDPGFAANDVLQFQLAGGRVFYHTLASSAAIIPQEATIDRELDRNHEAGSIISPSSPLIEVTALDTGRWGNRLRISVENEANGLVSGTLATGTFGANQIVLSSLNGAEPGTVLEMFGLAGTIGPLMKVVAVDRNNGRITLDAPLDPLHIAAIPAQIRSIEFSLRVRLMRRPDALIPSRDDTFIGIEEYRNLSMDPRHSRYFRSMIGDVNGPLRISDRRPEGSSWYVRTNDLGTPAAQLGIRRGPETLTDLLPTGVQRAARHALTGGNDGIALLTDADYVGTDANDPDSRTGLFALQNVEEISIVAVPGRTTVPIQNALITHCELMRYRFAVLDGPQPDNDLIADVRAQRQQFDTRYAALYHPWLVIPQPFPAPNAPSAFNIPPSGQVVGVYARTDIERGVHKAPANEVVRGISGLRRSLSKSEQDILNPYPVNINVIRDFRKTNRGIRIWGGRVITSDSDWKYVNVRRLLIFIEASIDRGLQWVVFEPNAEPLWARVRRTISNFLRVVWRNGALEGAKVEEAFFVRCDRTTMTQAEIDNGQLIVLVGVAPVKPAEFVIIRIGLWTAHTDD
jgi:phage tail sheath protein FI